MSAAAGPATRASALLPWLILAAAWFATTPLRPLLDPDEGRYAEIPREMLASGDWVTPRLNDLKYFEKPPLQYWATAAVYGVAGLHQWSSRLWAVGLAFACLPLVFAWAGRLYGRRSALIALTALATSPYFVIVGQLNLLDQAFTFWLSVAVLAFTLAQCAPHRSPAERRWMLLAWAGAALAVLSKGIVVGVLCGGALILYTLTERDARPWRRLHLLTGLPLFLLIAVPWFIAVTVRNPSFPAFFFVHEHFARFLTTVHQRVEPWWFFLPLLLGVVLPWIPAFARAVRAGWRAGAPPGGAPFRPLRFLLLYALLTLVFFSASGSKLVPYILPLVPAIAAVTGAVGEDVGGIGRLAARVVAGFLAFVALGLGVYSAVHNGYIPHAYIVLSCAALTAALAGLIVTLRRTGLPQGGAAFALAACALLAWQFELWAFTLIPPARSSRELAAAVRPAVTAATPLYSVGQYRETLSPYLARTFQLAGYEGELQFGLGEEPGRRMSEAQFVQRWSAGGEAVAFFDPERWDGLRRQGLPGRVIAFDDHTVAVSRQ
ncbi:MAG TPA: glycosyltransferase family 39 protein [Steroidobacteraceae bacterium]|jgi:4-amino-4-deoxy-L-arabinose transferase-like glycosyltransferase|nr:glycosyltransferase family 39 protein [Steroidobacteraceae bacterium]